ncbi:hypothetical protein CTAYLR_001337 [Chrysophaeum taylorii]|uniref:PH domain-containing protein n=1 Tax=Chrysophaeum taylorii TaxID=2483200 RepID=A0AAD7U5C0_9STRA|nr:hypothetical protein CTAYLR_001337 [Chrysophaeum taylorii]
MIQANVSSTQTMVNQRATEIRFKELTLFTDNLGVIASLAAFFAETSLDSLYIEPETVAKGDPKNMFSTACWALSAVTISLNLLTLLVAIHAMLYGPALAIRGPAGSMPLAVSRIFVQRKLALRLFWGGLLCKVVQASALAAWRYPPVVSVPVAAVFLAFVLATYRCILRVTDKFSFKQFGLRREDFIEISYLQNEGFASPPSGAPEPRRRGELLAGWLMKQTTYLKRWNSRYFVLTTDGELRWSTSTAAPARGSLDLRGAEIRVLQLQLNAPGVPAYGMAISRRDGQSVTELIVATDSIDSRSKWTRAILSLREQDSLDSAGPDRPLLSKQKKAGAP